MIGLFNSTMSRAGEHPIKRPATGETCNKTIANTDVYILFQNRD
jgi:hypothetical protein